MKRLEIWKHGNLLIVMSFTLLLMLLLNSCSDKPTMTKTLRPEINQIVNASTCSKMYWKDRGRAPLAYVKGIALMYAKQICGQGSDFIKSNKITGNNSIQGMKDALEYYGIKGSELNTYTFLLGLGMRESSGRYCEGRDLNASFTTADSAEAGVYQDAYVSRVFNKRLKPLYDNFNKSKCELDTFKKGVVCKPHNAKTWGNGKGVAWQKFTKVCPAFAVQWAAISIRSNYLQFGPIKHKEVEIRTECKDMLASVGRIAKKRCGEL